MMVLLSRSIAAGALRKAALAAAAALGLALLGCGGAVAQFEPVEAARRPAATYPVAAYDLRVGPSLLGKATVWSEGAADASRSDGDVLDVEMSIHNTTRAPIAVDVAGSRVNVTSRDGRTQSIARSRPRWMRRAS